MNELPRSPYALNTIIYHPGNRKGPVDKRTSATSLFTIKSSCNFWAQLNRVINRALLHQNIHSKGQKNVCSVTIHHLFYYNLDSLHHNRTDLYFFANDMKYTIECWLRIDNEYTLYTATGFNITKNGNSDLA